MTATLLLFELGVAAMVDAGMPDGSSDQTRNPDLN